MKNLKLFTLLFFTVAIYPQDIEWEKSYGGNQAEYLFDGIANADFEILNSENSISNTSLYKSDLNYAPIGVGIRTLVEEEGVNYDKKLNVPAGLSNKVDPANVSGCSIWKKQTTSKFVADKKETNLIDFLNFNQGISFSKEEQLIISKNKLTSSFTLFIVFKSNEQQEKDILNYNVGTERLKITNKKTLSTNGLEYSTYNSRNGVILEYSANLNGVKNSNICSLYFGDLSNLDNNSAQNQEKKSTIFEFIFYPRILTATEKLKIESYLSIKYGVSLVGEKNYLNASSTKIWNFNDNKWFNKNVTGIGKDENADLFQEQSLNSAENDIQIGFRSLDSNLKSTIENIENKTFLVWGNNGGNVVFKKDKSGQESPIMKINRVWKIQKTQVNNKNKVTTFLSLNDALFSSQMQREKEETKIWLVVSSNSPDLFDYESATYYKGEKTQDGKIIFKNIVWDKDNNGSDSFTFIKAPDLLMNCELTEQNCNASQNGRVKIKIIGGVVPFVLNIQHNGVMTSLVKNAREFEIETPTSGDYVLMLIDSKKQSFSQIIKTDLLASFEGLLASEWFLNEDSEVEIVPNINSKNAKATYSYQWKQDKVIISNERTLKINQQGDYSLKVKNDKGCEKTLPFRVLKSTTTHNEVTVYPNPVEANEDFKIKFNLEKPSSVEIKIYTISGALLKHDKIENISTSQYSYKLQTSGNYLIVITKDNQSITNKIIVN